MNRVIFHINEMQKWETLLGNVRNFLKADLDDAKILVLANGIAVKAYAREEYQEKLAKLIKQGVIFEACQNALNAYEVDTAQTIKGLKIVPAGVVELMQKQQDGYAYIKP